MEKGQKYVITRMDGRVFSFLLQDHKAVEIHCDGRQGGVMPGNIYIGKIKNIAKNIGAAFVETAPGTVCYLPLSDMKAPVYTKKGNSPYPQAGDELLVQISREALKSKSPAVTTNLTLHGKYVLLTMGDQRICASSKLPKEEKERLLSLAAPYFADDSADGQGQAGGQTACGWLLRTNAKGVGEDVLAGDIRRLKKRLRILMEQAQFRTCFSCLYAEPAPYLARLLNLYDAEADQIITDDRELYDEIRAFLEENLPEDLHKLSWYRDDLLPLRKLCSLDHQLSQALSQKVWLKSGGYLVIQPTEALTVIDVNTGKYEGGKKKEETFLKINREAAIESARQIRLRNLSGIILIDFINMESKEATNSLLALLDQELRRDPVRTVLVDMTKLSLVEITRQKKERTLLEAVNAQ